MAAIERSTKPVMIPGGEQREWITPEEQLNKLLKYHDPLVDLVAEKLSVAGVPEIVVEYAKDTTAYREFCTNWYKFLKKIDKLPPFVPALPQDIHKIFQEKCPILGDKAVFLGKEERAEDKAPYQVWERQTLLLVPAGTLNDLLACFNTYRQAHLRERGPVSFFQIQEYPETVNEQHGNIPFDKPQWILMLNGCWVDSKNKINKIHREMVDKLQKHIAPYAYGDEGVLCNIYELPRLREIITCIFFHMVLEVPCALLAMRNLNCRVQEVTEGDTIQFQVPVTKNLLVATALGQIRITEENEAQTFLVPGLGAVVVPRRIL